MEDEFVRSFVLFTDVYFAPFISKRTWLRGGHADGCSSRDALKRRETRGKDASLVKHNSFVFIREKRVKTRVKKVFFKPVPRNRRSLFVAL